MNCFFVLPVSCALKSFAFRNVSLVGLALLVVFVLSGCGVKDSEQILHFFSSCGLSGVPTNNITQVTSSLAVSRDYKNRVYFVLFHSSKDEFLDFLQTNNFQSEEVLSLPRSDDAHAPSWWHPTVPQQDQYSKRIGAKWVMAGWADEVLYLYGTD